MEPLMEPVTEAGINACLQTRRFGRPLRVEAQLSSTNTAAREWAMAGAPEGAAVAANVQSAGKGRIGRQFFSPAGGMYLSVVLRPDQGIDPGLITSCAAVAVAKAIESLCDLPVQIKWVNDLFIHGRKVCGILAEAGVSAETGDRRYVVLGIGINVAAVAFPPALAATATSLGNEGATVDRCQLIAAVLKQWEDAYAAMETGDFLEENRRRSLVLGREITVIRGDQTMRGVAQAITDAGHLRIRRPDGQIEELQSGEVSIRL